MFLTKTILFVDHRGLHATEKNAQHLQTGTHRIWTQHTLVDRKQQKTLYMSKDKVV